MNLTDLQIKIAEVLGVSVSQKELAYETFIYKVFESLHEGITLKVPRIGLFQLKAADSSNGPTRSIVFSALTEDFDRDSKNLYLTLSVTPKSKDASEFDLNVFSIGVGKPLLPLTDDDTPDSETSYAMLRKSVEERAKELIIESDQIPNFDLFEGYYGQSIAAAEKNKDIDQTLSNLTEDLDNVNEEEPEKKAEPITDEHLLTSLVNDTPDSVSNTSEVESIEEQAEEEEPVEIIRIEDEVQTIPNETQDEHKEVSEEHPEITLAELLGSTISDTEEFGANENVEIANEEGLVSISEFLSHDSEPPHEDTNEIKDEKENAESGDNETVNIETFLNQEQVIPDEKEPVESEETVSLKSVLEDEVSEEELTKNREKEEPEQKEELYELTDDKQMDGNVDVQAESKSEEDSVEEENPFEIELEKKSLKKDLFAVLDERIENLRLTSENVESGVDLNSLIENNDFDEPEEDDLLKADDDAKDEKIEWNWGDELKEEFGITHVEGEEAKFEMVDDTELGNEEEPISGNKLYKDLFAQLEKTIEKEKTIFEEDFGRDDWNIEREETPKQKHPTRDEAPTDKFSIKNDDKVYLEFSNPPSKYEFVAEKPPGHNKRMSVVLENEPPEPPRINRTYSRDNLPPKPAEPEKDNYFGKIALYQQA
jgi:hypothetical protein